MSIFIACGNNSNQYYRSYQPPIDDNETNIIDDNVTNIIIDTDMLTDNDDAGAISVAHSLAAKGELTILAMMITGIDLNQKRTKLVSAINYYYDNPDIPIGEHRASKNSAHRKNWSPFSLDYSRTDANISKSYNGTYRNIDNFDSDNCKDRAYRKDTKCGNRYDAVVLYCNILNNLPNNKKVTIAIIGNFYNVSDLLNEKTICNGKELIENKVDKLVCSGWFSKSDTPDTNFAGGHNKKTFKSAIQATQNVFNFWPSKVPIIILNEEVGNLEGMKVGKLYQKHNTHSPMAFSYAVDEGYTYTGENHAIDDGKSIWDHTVILYVARGLEHNSTTYWSKVSGTATIQNDGRVLWDDNTEDAHNHHYLKKNNNDYINLMNTLFINLQKFNPQY